MKTFLPVIAVALMFGARAAVAAEQQIRLKNGSTVSGTILEKDATYVVIGVPRSAIASVDGQPLADPLAQGVLAPTFSAVDRSGNAHTLGNPKDKVTLLHFWATWCPHCRSDLPLMKDLTTKFKNQPLTILSLSVDRDLKALENFMKDHSLPFPVIAAFDPRNMGTDAIPDRYEVRGVPSYYLIDTRGRIVETWSGSLSEAHTDIEPNIRRLVAEATPASNAAP